MDKTGRIWQVASADGLAEWAAVQMKSDETTSDDNQAGKGTNERVRGTIPKEQPKFPKWKLSHETLARQDPVKYRMPNLQPAKQNRDNQLAVLVYAMK
jgi:hypothetical protein